MLTNEPLFKSADAYQDDVLALPVDDLESSTKYYMSPNLSRPSLRSFGAIKQTSRSDRDQQGDIIVMPGEVAESGRRRSPAKGVRGL